ncbi:MULTISPECIES: hypothetical protein [Streptomyces]|uniref:Uncharacterized protein n=2 Tax=Streptomyces TaxID=1883 RepID=A0ABT9LRU5_STRGD|nr:MULTISPECIES: hypothetical protein [Streptomyces]MDP9686265.1 hypothetical protein [Streptomyces griseoviridis]GGT15728.1 hypothetical protein GCM10010240_56170 [Streptomyces griseoviridis]GGU57608.1 hypothetical protein GCM10010259_55820 [Streptomyces daghestanicus]GHI35558.1 hypothetical protein Sdagh_72880 [Streptomyces daghestanicus]
MNAAVNPEMSVLRPMVLPSGVKTTVLTAPIREAVAASPSRREDHPLERMGEVRAGVAHVLSASEQPAQGHASITPRCTGVQQPVEVAHTLPVGFPLVQARG